MDGEYLSPHVFKFFSEDPGENEHLKIKFLEDSYVLEIPITDKINEYLYKYQHHDMFVKIDYLARHEAFSKFQFESLVLLSRQMHLKTCRYGDIVMKNGERADFLQVIRCGNVSVRLLT